MTIRINIFGVLILLLSSQYLFTGYAQESSLSQLFSVANVRFEQNATDGDVEVVFEVKGGDEGLTMLTVVSPDGRTVIDFTAPNSSTLGIRQFRFESPEPKDVDGLKAAYPEGVYKCSGFSINGKEYYSESTLNHKLPATVFFLQPGANEEDVMIERLKIKWTPVENLSAYIIEIDQEKLDVNLIVKLTGSVTEFSVPEGFLQSGLEYTLSIGTVAKDGNSSFVETSFTIAEEE